MILYKYCDSNGVNLVKDSEIKLPYMSELNDPFEFLPRFVFDETKEDRVVKKAMSATFRIAGKHPIDGANNIKNELRNGELKNNCMSIAESKFREYKEANCLVSVSEDPKNILMWAHYAEKHHGIVVGIDFENLLGNGAGIKMHPALYSHAKTEVDLLIESDDEAWKRQFENLAMVKSIIWGYEKEYRNAIPEDWLKANGGEKKLCSGKSVWFLKINSASIKDVVFGLKTSQDIRDEILELKKTKKFSHLRVREVVLDQANYEFEIRDL